MKYNSELKPLKKPIQFVEWIAIGCLILGGLCGIYAGVEVVKAFLLCK